MRNHRINYNGQSSRYEVKTPVRSLFENYLRRGPSRTDPDIMNSWKGSVQLKFNKRFPTSRPKSEDSYKPKQYVFKYRVPATTLEIDQTIEALESWEQQDIIRWVKNFKETVVRCGWAEEVAMNVMRSITNVEHTRLYQNYSSLEAMLAGLLHTKYPATASHRYYQELSTIKQES